MKKILQAAALILLATLVVYAAAHSSTDEAVSCHREWEKVADDKKHVNESKPHYAENYSAEQGVSGSAYK